MTETSSSPRTPSKSPSAASSSPPSGSASNRVESADEVKDMSSLAGMARIDADQFGQPASSELADTTNVVTIEGHSAAKSTGDVSASGQALPDAGTIAGGAIEKVLDAPVDQSKRAVPWVKERAAILSPVGQKLAGLINRPVSEWGLLGPGDVVKGHMTLLDLNSGEKTEALDGHRIGEGQLYMNLINAPQALSAGDTIKQILG